jgi:hypothetical protein
VLASYRLKDLKPIKTVLEADPRVRHLVKVVKDMSCLRPIVVAKTGNVIIDGNKLWAALKILHGEEHICTCYPVDVIGDSMWVAHIFLNRHEFGPSIETILRPLSEELKWRLLSRMQLAVSMEGGNARKVPAETFLKDLGL